MDVDLSNQEIELPAEMKRAMAKQAEAERERRAVIIASQGELSASENLRQAAQNLSKSSGALTLRTLQTIRDIAADPSEKIIMFMPTEIGEAVAKAVSRASAALDAMLDDKTRYLQLAFNYDARMVGWLLPRVLIAAHPDRGRTPVYQARGMAVFATSGVCGRGWWWRISR